MRSPGIRNPRSTLTQVAVGVAAGAVALATIPGLASAQPGALDTTFNPNASSSVFAVNVLGNGNLLLGGNFGLVRGELRDQIARIGSDGTLDTSFANPQPNRPGMSSTVVAMAVQPDGKVLIAGTFTRIGGQDRDRVARLNADGTLDTTFVDPNVDGAVSALALEPDGQVLIGGLFTMVDGLQRKYVARLNADGTRANNFLDPNANDSVSAIALQPDGKVVVGGSFTSVGGFGRNYIARINENGGVDAGFNPDAGGSVTAITRLDNGKMLIGGAFGRIGAENRDLIARINADGTPDTSFVASIGAGLGHKVADIVTQPDGKVLIGGEFSTIDGQARGNAARLHADGGLDTSFADPGTNNGVETVAMQPDGKVLIGGYFTSVAGVERNRIARLLATTPESGAGERPATRPQGASPGEPGAGRLAPSPPRRLAGRLSLRKSAAVTTGTVPPGATRVAQVATTGTASAAQAFLDMARAKRATGTCRITTTRNPRATRVTTRTYRCTIRLTKGTWTVTTTARGTAGIVAQGTRRVVVR